MSKFRRFFGVFIRTPPSRSDTVSYPSEICSRRGMICTTKKKKNPASVFCCLLNNKRPTGDVQQKGVGVFWDGTGDAIFVDVCGSYYEAAPEKTKP